MAAFWLLFYAPSLVLNANNGAIDESVFVVQILRHDAEKVIINAFLSSSPKTSGKEQLGEPVRTCHKTPPTNNRLSAAVLPTPELLLGRYGVICFQTPSQMTNRTEHIKFSWQKEARIRFTPVWESYLSGDPRIPKPAPIACPSEDSGERQPGGPRGLRYRL